MSFTSLPQGISQVHHTHIWTQLVTKCKNHVFVHINPDLCSTKLAARRDVVICMHAIALAYKEPSAECSAQSPHPTWVTQLCCNCYRSVQSGSPRLAGHALPRYMYFPFGILLLMCQLKQMCFVWLKTVPEYSIYGHICQRTHWLDIFHRD